jgi:hypothetical protein
MTLVGLLIRNGLIHKAYRRWEIIFRGGGAEVERFQLSNIDFRWGTVNYIGRDQINTAEDHS